MITYLRTLRILHGHYRLPYELAFASTLTSMVTFPHAILITRPATLSIFDPKLGFKGLSALLLATFENPGS